jgi:hypothetical protein
MYKVIGTIKVIGETIQVTEKFSKRDLVITDQSMYPQDISFQLSQDKCSMLDAFQNGNQVEVSFNLRGREWANPTTGEVKYFNTLDAWRIEQTSFDRTNHEAEKEVNHPSNPAQESTTEEDDDLPF